MRLWIFIFNQNSQNKKGKGGFANILWLLDFTGLYTVLDTNYLIRVLYMPYFNENAKSSPARYYRVQYQGLYSTFSLTIILVGVLLGLPMSQACGKKRFFLLWMGLFSSTKSYLLHSAPSVLVLLIYGSTLHTYRSCGILTYFNSRPWALYHWIYKNTKFYLDFLLMLLKVSIYTASRCSRLLVQVRVQYNVGRVRYDTPDYITEPLTRFFKIQQLLFNLKYVLVNLSLE